MLKHLLLTLTLLLTLNATPLATTQQTVSTLVGALAGGGTGASTGLDGEKYNRQLHQREIAWIKAHAAAFAKANGLSVEEAQKLLTLGSLGMVDAEDNSKIQYLIRTGQLSQEQIQNAQSYIKGHVVQEQATFPDEHRHYGSDLVPESSKTQAMFTVSQEQYYNHDYNPNTDMGGLGVSPVLEILPIGKGFSLGKAGVKGVGGRIKGKDSAVNVANYEKLKDDLFRRSGKPLVSDKKLQSFIDKLYRDNAQIGNGSTADAVRYELKTGNSVRGKFHSQKAEDSIRYLEKWLENGKNTNPADRLEVEHLIKDMRNALKGK